MPELVANSAHYLYPSTLFASSQASEVITVLGSCVSVCLWDWRRRSGGINHYMLPFWNGEGLSSPKFGNIANSRLLEKMLGLGSQKKDLVAKVFGGANQLQQETNLYNIGKRNVHIAIEMLQTENIPIISAHTEGGQGRKIKFYTHTGEVLLKLL
jgi:chemotaxis protein CheD